MIKKLKTFVKKIPKILAWGFAIYIGLIVGFLILMGIIAFVTGDQKYWNMLMSV